MSMNERPIPEAALLDESSVEMMRVWIANKKLHTSLKIGMYRETSKVMEEKAWGRILADAARHIADALEEMYASNREESVEAIRKAFNSQLDEPSSLVKGGFVQRH